MADSLLDYRDRFPILHSTTYLINNSLGAMPGAVADRMKGYADVWAERGVRAWAEEWWTMPGDVGDLVAPLLGARPGTVSMHTNVTLATAVFFSCLRPDGKRTRVVTTELQFPSIQYFLSRWCEERGIELHAVPASDGLGSDQQQLLDAIDDTTLAVSVSHVEFKSAFINDASAIAKRCRETGALLLLDAFQATGVVPVEVEKWGVDACVGGCLKWLCGGPGNVYLYVDPDLAQRLEPRLTGWMAHPAPFSFEGPPMRWRDDSYKFLNGTPQVACLYAAPPGLEMHNEIGVPAIREKSKRMTRLIFDGANERGWRTRAPADPERRGGTVAVDVPHGELVAQELNARDIVIDYRPGAGIRIAPHFYNSEEECRFALEQIDEILRTKAYERHQSVAGAMPT
ncbi:MAG: aminotransferase class V-fold PLP-dependent enzyme [Planctomycetota bacterium]|jgi:kynureninase